METSQATPRRIGTGTEPVVVVSDLHASARRPAAVGQFIAFLETWAGERAEVLLINGDLFDFWLEYRTVVRSDVFELLATLAAVVDRGVRVVFVPGNHDAWVGDFLTRELGVELLPGPADVLLAGRRTLLAHGDELLPTLLPSPLRSPTWRHLLRLLHPDLVHRIMAALSHTGRPGARHRTRALRRARQLRRRAEEVLGARAKLDLVLFGHSHVPELHRAGSGRCYLNSGDWVDHRTYSVIGERIEQREWS